MAACPRRGVAAAASAHTGVADEATPKSQKNHLRARVRGAPVGAKRPVRGRVACVEHCLPVGRAGGALSPPHRLAKERRVAGAGEAAVEGEATDIRRHASRELQVRYRHQHRAGDVEARLRAGLDRMSDAA